MKKSEDGKALFGLFHLQDIKKWALLFYIYIVTGGNKKNFHWFQYWRKKFQTVQRLLTFSSKPKKAKCNIVVTDILSALYNLK